METGKRRLKRLLIVLVVGVLGGLSVWAVGLGATNGQPDEGKRADTLTIDAMAAYGPLTQPKVAFLHDKHTATLGKQKDFYKKACATCHLTSKEGTMFLGFRRDDAPMTGDTLRETFHKGCIGCHMDMAAAGQKSGPKDGQCKGCHNAAPDVISDWQSLTVDKRLHFRHAATQEKAENKCGACHLVYSEAAGKVVPVTKPEDVPGACVYCHAPTTTTVPGRKPETIRSLRLAVHGQCVTCHLDTAAKGPDVATGPVTCAGCHSPSGQEAIARHSRERVPADADLRIKRGQPDLTMIRPTAAAKPVMGLDGKPVRPVNMPPVPFDHKYHESQNETCVGCHHAALSSCAGDCHTLRGDRKGGFVTLEQAMHDEQAGRSCAGCHAVQQKRPECAGCHVAIKWNIANTDACAGCHMTPPAACAPAEAALVAGPKDKDTAAAAADLAGRLLAGHRTATATFPIEDIPETVTLGSLADTYAPAALPHRKIVLALLAGMKDSKLAGAFHQGDAAVCQGCHHNSPAGKTPPRCGNCHPAAEIPGQSRPALKAAYHGKCMGCHTAMGISGMVVDRTPGAQAVPKATDCTGCHGEKKR